MTIKEILSKGMIMLKGNNVDSPKLKARLLLQYILKKPRQYLIVYDNEEVGKKEQWEYFVNIEKLANGVPLQHITHQQEFMKMNFYVDENVLIPRPDTEILVEEVIKLASKINEPKILDLCTGSGAIAISIAKNVPNAEVYAIDISSKAIEVAKKNAKELGAKVKFVKSNLFNKLDKMKFDIIVSNPPYIAIGDTRVDAGAKHDPKCALYAKNQGLSAYEQIAKNARNWIKSGGKIYLEIGAGQMAAVKKIFESAGWQFNRAECDMSGITRVLVFTI